MQGEKKPINKLDWQLRFFSKKYTSAAGVGIAEDNIETCPVGKIRKLLWAALWIASPTPNTEHWLILSPYLNALTNISIIDRTPAATDSNINYPSNGAVNMETDCREIYWLQGGRFGMGAALTALETKTVSLQMCYLEADL